MIASRKMLLAIIAINAVTFVYMLLAASPHLDFRCFYSSAKIARRAPAHIYDPKYQLVEQQEEFGDRAFIPFCHPPQELLIFAPLSTLPYATAFAVWRLFSVLCLVLSGLILAAAIGANRINTVLLCAATYPVLMCLTVGQDSILLLLLISGCFYLLKTNRDVWAALVLGLALFKPQLPVVFAVAMLAIGRARFFAWFAAFSSALAGASLAYVGWHGAVDMVRDIDLADRVGYGVAGMSTVRGMLALLGVDSRTLAFVILIAAVAATFPLWRRHRSLEFAVSTSICLESALAVHLFPDDLVVLAIPLLIVLAAGRIAKPILVPVFAAITSGPLGMLAFIARAPSLLLLPTLALAAMTFRLNSSVRESRSALAADAGSD